MVFWIATAGLLAITLWVLYRAMRAGDLGGDAGAQDVQVYRDQLAEVDRDAARGVLSETEAEAARIEVSRRLLDADTAAQSDAGTAGSKRAGLAYGLAAVITVAASYGVYLKVGAPGYPDMPLQARLAAAEDLRTTRPDQAAAEAAVPPRPPVEVGEDVQAMVVQLRQILETRTEDVRGFRLLARHEAGLGNLSAAWRAQSRVVDLLADEATGQDFASLGELQIMAAGGYVSPSAEAALAQALERDPRNGTARYYMGLMFAQTGRPDLTFNIWRGLLADSRPDAPWLDLIYLQIEDISARAGDPTPLDQLPRPQADTTQPGPTADDIEAAAALSMQDRVEMIRGMVGQLADRLATEGGPPEDWARLISSLGVLGNTDAAFQVYSEASRVFADDQGALDVINSAADQAGVNPDGLEFQ